MLTTPADTFPALALDRLRTLTGDPGAGFRPDQLEAIRDVVLDRARVLCVQRTGWGKSAVYFIATALLREAGAGPTLIVSPLLALMRNQIAAAERLGLRAHTINSTNRDAWDLVRDRLDAGTVDLLLISPERLNNAQFRDEMLPLFAASVGLLVIDEAHCISDWGHDFRPDYRRVKDMLDRLPPGVAVLGTTATANDRVVADVASQLAADVASQPAADGAEHLRTYRGRLARRSLRLEVLDLPQPAQRLAWLATHVPELPGSGIVYTLTRRDADQVAAFLSARGIAAVAYSGEHETDTRISIEDRLLGNQVKAVVATSALGMGYDKPDLSFVVHYQAPGSVISYYQQIGRAGRGIEHADIVLLRGGEDRSIQDFFIEQAFPAREHVAAVLNDLDASGDDGRTTRELMAVVNLGMSRIEAMLKILDVEGAVTRAGTRWKLVPDAAWTYDAERYAQVTALRRAEQRAMAAFGTDGRCLMRVLQEELDDPAPADCGRCAVCAGPRFAVPLDPALVEAAGRHLRATPIELEVKKMAPDTAGVMRKIPEEVRVEPGLGARPLRRRRLVARDRAGCARRRIRGRRCGGAVGHPARRRRGLVDLRAVGQARQRAGAAWRARRAGAGDRLRPARGARGRPPTPARDGQRRPAGGQRARRLPHRGSAASRDRRAARRPAAVRVDAGHGRRAAAARRRRTSGAGGAGHARLTA